MPWNWKVTNDNATPGTVRVPRRDGVPWQAQPAAERGPMLLVGRAARDGAARERQGHAAALRSARMVAANSHVRAVREAPRGPRMSANLGRCECRDANCFADGLAAFEDGRKADVNEHEAAGAQCFRDAVRTAVVGGGIWSSHDWRDVPMCEPCAAYHEAKTERASHTERTR